jgi:hypothetical protein
MSGVEHASGARFSTPRESPFPPEWGTPPGRVEERAKWIRVHVERAKYERRSRSALNAQRRLLDLRKDGP